MCRFVPLFVTSVDRRGRWKNARDLTARSCARVVWMNTPYTAGSAAPSYGGMTTLGTLVPRCARIATKGDTPYAVSAAAYSGKARLAMRTQTNTTNTLTAPTASTPWIRSSLSIAIPTNRSPSSTGKGPGSSVWSLRWTVEVSVPHTLLSFWLWPIRRR